MKKKSSDEKEDESKFQFQKQAELFKNRGLQVAVELINGYRYSGDIITISADFIEIKDWKIGNIPLFYRQIRIIVPVPKRMSNVEEDFENYSKGGGYQP